jgi:hypothetical protein
MGALRGRLTLPRSPEAMASGEPCPAGSAVAADVAPLGSKRPLYVWAALVMLVVSWLALSISLDFPALFLVPREGHYRLEIQASSPADEADLLEPVWTEVVNSFTSL